MIEIAYTASFLRKLKRIQKKDQELFKEILDKVELFKNKENHPALRVHKLHGYFKNYHSFSVTYKIRIILEYLDDDSALLLGVDDHDGYR